MNEENKIGYYAIIPATVLFNENIKANEKLLYAVITVLSNKEGYCFASNKYLGNLLNAQPHTISKWVSHLKELGFICLDIIRDDKGEIINQFKNNADDLILKNMHNQASVELSKPRKLSNMAYRNWNKSAFTYNEKKKRYEFREELGRSYDVPKYIKVEVL